MIRHVRIGRTVPPAAAPLSWRDLWHGVAGACSPARSVRALEREIREHFGVRHVFLVSSGTAALTLALEALKSLSRRREVVIPAYTCFSVPAAVVRAGLRPVPCDIDPATFDFDHALLEEKLNADTLCVIAHHLFGIPSDMERMGALCAPRGAFVVEDAAQAMGAQDKGRALGTMGDLGVFSLGRGKNITCGSGGIVVTSRDEIARAVSARCRRLEAPRPAEGLKDLVQLMLMAVFIRPRLYWIPAAVPFLRLGQTERDRIHALSQKRGLGISVAYPTAVDGIPEIRAHVGGQRFPSAQRVAERLLTIPTHHWLSEKDKRAIAECVGATIDASRLPHAWRRAS